MRSICFAAIVVFSILFFTNASWSQEDFGPPISGSPITFETAEDVSLNVPQDSPLRQQYLELAKTKAELMTDETLKQEIAATQRNINELKALQKLQDAQEMLLSLTKEFPESEAAAKAKHMLEAIEALGPRAMHDNGLSRPLNAAAETPFRRSSQSRELLPPTQPDPLSAPPANGRGPQSESSRTTGQTHGFPPFNAR